MSLFAPVLDLIHGGGWFVMGPLAGAALALWYLIGLRLMTLRSGGALERALDAIKQGANASVIAHETENLIDQYGVWIRAIVICAPLAGLLGTVDGMIETFDALGEMSLHRSSGGIAGGISQALITTQMGLAIAIPGMLVSRLLDRRAERLKERLHHFVYVRTT